MRTMADLAYPYDYLIYTSLSIYGSSPSAYLRLSRISGIFWFINSRHEYLNELITNNVRVKNYYDSPPGASHRTRFISSIHVKVSYIFTGLDDDRARAPTRRASHLARRDHDHDRACAQIICAMPTTWGRTT